VVLGEFDKRRTAPVRALAFEPFDADAKPVRNLLRSQQIIGIPCTLLSEPTRTAIKMQSLRSLVVDERS
jgi:hypothetical protein